MPTFEYLCEACAHRFEVLVRTPKQKVVCAKCKSKKITKKFSVFQMNFGAEPGKAPGGKLCGCGEDGCAPCSAGL
jgi:putative FmdB family regulatory protein